MSEQNEKSSINQETLDSLLFKLASAQRNHESGEASSIDRLVKKADLVGKLYFLTYGICAAIVALTLFIGRISWNVDQSRKEIEANAAQNQALWQKYYEMQLVIERKADRK